MPTLTFILGLCGSGKTWLADRIIGEKFDESFLKDETKHGDLIDTLRSGKDCIVFDESFFKDKTKHDDLIVALRSGKDCIVIEIAYCCAGARQQIIREVTNAVPNVKINWLCIENDLDRANKNCRERTNKGDPDGHVEINQKISPCYTCPEGGVVLKMWTKDC